MRSEMDMIRKEMAMEAEIKMGWEHHELEHIIRDCIIKGCYEDAEYFCRNCNKEFCPDHAHEDRCTAA